MHDLKFDKGSHTQTIPNKYSQIQGSAHVACHTGQMARLFEDLGVHVHWGNKMNVALGFGPCPFGPPVQAQMLCSPE